MANCTTWKGSTQRNRVRQPLGDRGGDPARRVARDQLDPRTALGAEQVEEALDSLAVTTAASPHQPARVVADDDRQIALALAMADLVDADPPQAGEQIDLALLLGRDPPPEA